jgi:hypothetical protein
MNHDFESRRTSPITGFLLVIPRIVVLSRLIP